MGWGVQGSAGVTNPWECSRCVDVAQGCGELSAGLVMGLGDLTGHNSMTRLRFLSVLTYN